MRPDEFMRKYGFDDDSLNEREHSLEENARERAGQLHRPNAGSPHDWEEWEMARRELGLEVDDNPDPKRPTRNLTPDDEALQRPSWLERLKAFFRRR